MYAWEKGSYTGLKHAIRQVGLHLATLFKDAIYPILLHSISMEIWAIEPVNSQYGFILLYIHELHCSECLEKS